MDTQNTPVHPYLWHRGFLKLTIANFLLTFSLYLLVPQLFADHSQGYGLWPMAVMTGGYGVGLFVLGPFCNYFIQRYRRNRVCLLSMFLFSLTIFGHYIYRENPDFPWTGWELPLLRIISGAMFGLAQMILCSTLVIDICESQHRTQANLVTAWSGRMAIGLGMSSALFLLHYYPNFNLYILSASLSILPILLISMVRFPFKAPEETAHRISLDRFFLIKGLPLFFKFLLISVSVGLYLVQNGIWSFYAMVSIGLFFSFCVEYGRPVCRSGKTVICTALLLAIFSVMLLQIIENPVTSSVFAILLGFSLGCLGNRILLQSIELSDHCQRGTAQSSYFLTREVGISLGLILGYSMPTDSGTHKFALSFIHPVFVACLIALLALLMFLVFPPSWHVRHKKDKLHF